MKTLPFILAAIVLLPDIHASAETHAVDVKRSTLQWHASKLGGDRTGTISLKSGSVDLDLGVISSGMFVIDMTSINNTDIENEKRRKTLVDHLKSDAFFGVATYPEGYLKILKATAFENEVSKIQAELTIKGHTHPILFEVHRDGTSYDTELVIDRSLYNIRYGSGNFFQSLGDRIINDKFKIQVHLVLQ
jgi:polyisoprenoid-binding protein YceI